MTFRQNYDEVLDAIIAVDPRFHRDAYHFVREGLDYTQSAISKQEEGAVRHISGQELLGGMRAHAIEQYGPMALMVPMAPTGSGRGGDERLRPGPGALGPGPYPSTRLTWPCIVTKTYMFHMKTHP